MAKLVILSVCVFLVLFAASAFGGTLMEQLSPASQNGILEKFHPVVKTFSSKISQDLGNSTDSIQQVYNVVFKTLAGQVEAFVATRMSLKGQSLEASVAPTTLQLWSAKTKELLTQSLRSVTTPNVDGSAVCCYCRMCFKKVYVPECDHECCKMGRGCECHICHYSVNQLQNPPTMKVDMTAPPTSDSTKQSIDQLVDELVNILMIHA